MASGHSSVYGTKVFCVILSTSAFLLRASFAGEFDEEEGEYDG